MRTLRSGKRYRVRPKLERDLLLAPQAAAERVLEEASGWLVSPLPRRYAFRLAWQARIIFARSASFREKLRRPGEEGRDLLHAFMRHWLAARLKSERPDAYRALPAGFNWGETPPSPPPLWLLSLAAPRTKSEHEVEPSPGSDFSVTYLSPDARMLFA